MSKATLHMLHTCPFCWKVRGLIEYLHLDVDLISVNGLKIKKAVSFADGWGKVPVFTDENGSHHVDSTPIMKFIDKQYNGSKLLNVSEQERTKKWLESLILVHARPTTRAAASRSPNSFPTRSSRRVGEHGPEVVTGHGFIMVSVENQAFSF